jgi:hypothetical protein
LKKSHFIAELIIAKDSVAKYTGFPPSYVGGGYTFNIVWVETDEEHLRVGTIEDVISGLLPHTIGLQAHNIVFKGESNGNVYPYSQCVVIEKDFQGNSVPPKNIKKTTNNENIFSTDENKEKILDWLLYVPENPYERDDPFYDHNRYLIYTHNVEDGVIYRTQKH